MATTMSDPSILPVFHVVGFTGHRQLAEPQGVARAIGAELLRLKTSAAGEWIALSSVAVGGDHLFVRETQKHGLVWHAILPLPKAEFRSDFSSDEWTAAEEVLTQAEQVRVISENGSREDAYLDCGMETVNGCDVLLAVWDGEPARGKGGTADVVEYARSLGKPLIVIDAKSFAVTRLHFETFEPDDATLKNLNALPSASSGWGENPFKAPAAIFAFQQKCDFAASRGAPHFRRLIVFTVMLHVIATLLAAAALSYDLHWLLLPWLKLLCLAGALGVALLLRHHHHSLRSWVRCRLAAEFCRSALATWGLPRATPLFEENHVKEARGLMRTLQVMHGRSAAAEPVPIDEFRRLYLEKRIDDQLAYYRGQEARALPQFRRLKLGFWIATILALVCTLSYAVSHTAHGAVPDSVAMTVFYFLPIFLPVLAASFISLISINDLQRRVARYREMQVVLEDSRKRVNFCQTWNSLERIVLRTERALRQEMLEWHSVTSFTESH